MVIMPKSSSRKNVKKIRDKVKARAKVRHAAEAHVVVHHAQDITDWYAAFIAADGSEVLIRTNLYWGGDCTARTKAGRRCKNPVWPHGQVTGWSHVAVVNGQYYNIQGPLFYDETCKKLGWGDPAERYITQRCKLHPEGVAEAFCEPEWTAVDDYTLIEWEQDEFGHFLPGQRDARLEHVKSALPA